MEGNPMRPFQNLQVLDFNWEITIKLLKQSQIHKRAYGCFRKFFKRISREYSSFGIFLALFEINLRLIDITKLMPSLKVY